MSPEIIPESAIVISDNEELGAAFSSLLTDSGYAPIHFCRLTSEADRLISKAVPGLVIVDIPHGDSDKLELTADISEIGSIAVVAMVDGELYSQYRETFQGKGIYLLPKPLSGPMLAIAIDWLSSTRERLSLAEKKSNSVVERRIDELKLINRAKWLLISELRMDEPHAHRYIEKQAMDRSITRREIAAEIIRTYSK